MALTTAEEIYERIIKLLPSSEKQRLVEKIVHDLSKSEPPKLHDWMSIRGIAPNLLCGTEAQEWVSQTRRESDKQREKQWNRNHENY